MEQKFKEVFDDFMDNLLDISSVQYYETAEHRLLDEKREQMHNDCKYEFTEEQHHFVKQCFELLSDTYGAEINHVFRKAFLYGVMTARQIGAI